jgi:hypothetical protein
MTLQKYRDTLVQCLMTLRHARAFITSSEQMPQSSVEIYDQLVKDVVFALRSPGPEVRVERVMLSSPSLDGTCFFCDGDHGGLQCPEIAPRSSESEGATDRNNDGLSQG